MVYGHAGRGRLAGVVNRRLETFTKVRFLCHVVTRREVG